MGCQARLPHRPQVRDNLNLQSTQFCAYSESSTDQHSPISLGEYAALCIAGALTLEDTLRIVATRAKIMTENCILDNSGMLACNSSPGEIEAMLADDPALAQLTVACFNSIKDCVIGGPLEQLEKFQIECQTRKIRHKMLKVPYAYHTSAMDPILQPLRELGQSIEIKQPVIPVISNVHGRFFQNELSSDYFAKHARQPVHFHEGVLSLQKSITESGLDGAMFLELGPHPTSLPMLRNSLPSKACTFLATLQKGQNAWSSLSETLSAVSLRKLDIKWREVFADTSAKVTSLPGHLLEGPIFLTRYEEPRAASTPAHKSSGRVKTNHHLLPWLNTAESSDKDLIMETDMTILAPLISGHDVGGIPICPASVFHELAIEAAQSLLEPMENNVLVVSKMNFANPLVHIPSVRQGPPLTVSVRVSRKLTASFEGAFFEVTSRNTTEGSTATVHCTGDVLSRKLNANHSDWQKDHALVTRQSRYFSSTGKDHMSTFRTKVLYESIFTRVVKYSPEYQSLVYLNVADSNLEGIGSFRLPPGPDLKAGYLAHPVFTDTLLHAAGFIANLAIQGAEIGICARVESIEIAYRDINYSDSFTVYCNLLEVKGAIIADTIAMDRSGTVVAVIRGMEFRKLQLSAFRQALSRISSPPAAKPHRLPVAPNLSKQLRTGLDTPPITDEITVPFSAELCSRIPVQAGISQTLKDVVMEVGGFSEQELDPAKSLSDLGIDSLMQIEMAAKLARLFPNQTGLSHYELSQCDTLEALDTMLSSALSPAVTQEAPKALNNISGKESYVPRTFSSSQSTVIAESTTSDHSATFDTRSNPNPLPVTLHMAPDGGSPLFLFHDGSGQVSMYARLSGHDRSTYAFYNPHFGSNANRRKFHGSVREMAEEYASAIIHSDKFRSSPLILGGKSPIP